MSIEFKIDSSKRLLVYNRAVYAFMLLSALLSRISELTDNYFLMYYYTVIPIFLIIFDRFVFFRRIKKLESQDEFPYTFMRVRTYIYVFLLSSGGIIDIVPASLIVCIFLCIVYIIFQDILFCDRFDSFNSCLFISVSLLISGILIFFKYRSLVNGIWKFGLLAPIMVVIIVCDILYLIYSRSVRSLNERYKELLFKNEDTIRENEKLIAFKDKVEKVNREINYQRISLARANDDLAESNNESRSLIGVMKFFSSSFDIEKNAEVMVDNIMKLKNARAVGMYISDNIYMNGEPFIYVNAVDDATDRVLRSELMDIYNLVVETGSFDPLPICLNREFKYPLLSGAGICNAAAFPAYENEKIYGVMVVISGKYDFFINGYAFYETSVMDFTSALISDRLYLKTEEMAKKDGLTKIYNRIYFNQFYHELKEEVLKCGDRLTVAMMDIDRFKNVNDTYGHLAGDEVIKMVASIDSKYAAKHQGTAVRFGGEEFLLILRGVGIDEAHQILKEMHDEIKSTVVEFEDQKIQVNTSMGVASYKDTCDNIENLLDLADKAMYFSKTHGRGMIVIDGQYNEDEPAVK